MINIYQRPQVPRTTEQRPAAQQVGLLSDIYIEATLYYFEYVSL